MSTAPKKKTASSEAIVGNAATVLQRAVKAAQETITTLSDLTTNVEDRQYQIAELESKIDGLTVQFNEKERSMKIQVDLDIKAYKMNAATKIADENSCIIVESMVYNKLKDDHSKLVTEFDKKLSAETNIKLGAIQSNYNNQIALAEANAKADTAKLTSDLETAQNQIKFLNDQITMWKGQLDAERNAGIARAQAGAVGTINLSAPGK